MLHNKIIAQFIRFGIVGVSNTLLSYALYLIFLKLFERFLLFPTHDYIVSSILTFCLCTTWSFYWNNKFTFRNEINEKSNLLTTFVKTVLSYSFTGLFLHNTLLYVLVEHIGLAKEIVPILSLFITIPLNFLLNKYWVFG